MTYAILGATGQVGGSILQLLGADPENKINVLVRSRLKLESTYPRLSSNENIRVFEGSISDHDALTKCLRDTHAVFLTVAVTQNAPGTRISLTTAEAVIRALQTLRTDTKDYSPPRLVVLSSASLDDCFWTTVPRLVHTVMYAANAYIYDDLARAEAFLRKHMDWLDMTFFMPGGLTHDVQQGHELSTQRQQTFVSFLDAAAGMVEIADREERGEGKHVSVVLREGRKAGFEWWAPVVLGKGLLSYFVPGLFAWLP